MVVGHRFHPSRKQEDQKFKISLSRPGLPEILASKKERQKERGRDREKK